MAPLLQHQQRRRQQQRQEIQHKQLDKTTADKGKVKPAALFFNLSSTAMDCSNALSLFHLL
jgi:hypothetical protein